MFAAEEYMYGGDEVRLDELHKQPNLDSLENYCLLLISILYFNKKLKIVEFGSGHGHFALKACQFFSYKNQFTYHGFDQDHTSVASANRKLEKFNNASTSIKIISEKTLPQLEDFSDIFFLQFFLEHLPKVLIVPFLSTLRDKLKPNGKIICIEPIISKVECLPRINHDEDASALAFLSKWKLIHKNDNCDHDIGNRMAEYAKMSKLSIVGQKSSAIILSGQAASDFLLREFNDLNGNYKSSFSEVSTEKLKHFNGTIRIPITCSVLEEAQQSPSTSRLACR
ncbi:MAG: class I SAM-dependent methyltransferase, partial [Legionellales bacterium]|nr:class I SAM-dependent methyltransferase [Legionellales bacterium]